MVIVGNDTKQDHIYSRMYSNNKGQISPMQKSRFPWYQPSIASLSFLLGKTETTRADSGCDESDGMCVTRRYHLLGRGYMPEILSKISIFPSHILHIAPGWNEPQVLPWFSWLFRNYQLGFS